MLQTRFLSAWRIELMSSSQSSPDGKRPYNEFCWITGTPVIGEETWIGGFTLIDGLGGLTIGKGCDISSGAQILSHSTVRRCLSERKEEIEYCETIVEDHVFIGSNAVVLMGCKIGHHSIIAAGAVLLEGTVVPPYSLYAGVPARFIKSVKSEYGPDAKESAT